MFRDKVKQEIEAATKNLLDKNIFIQKARKGDLSKEQISRHIKNILYSIEFTPTHLKTASERLKACGQPEIALFMDEKFNEEVGHDHWAKADLANLGSSNRIQHDKDLTKGIIELVKYIEVLVNNEPLKYIAYMTFVEYFTVLAAPEFLDCVEKKCGVPRTSLSVVSKHGELDKHHTDDDLNAIEKFVDSPQKKREFLNVIYKTAEILDHHFTECAEAA